MTPMTEFEKALFRLVMHQNQAIAHLANIVADETQRGIGEILRNLSDAIDIAQVSLMQTQQAEEIEASHRRHAPLWKGSN